VAREIRHGFSDFVRVLDVRVVTRAIEKQKLRAELGGDPLRLPRCFAVADERGG